MCELLDKDGEGNKKEKRKITDHMIGQKKREICALCSAFGEASVKLNKN